MTSNILIYQTEDGQTKIETILENETVWLTQAQLCELFQKSKSIISEHIKTHLLPKSFMPRFKIDFILRLLGRHQQR